MGKLPFLILTVLHVTYINLLPAKLQFQLEIKLMNQMTAAPGMIIDVFL